jgi:hypothetical protein
MNDLGMNDLLLTVDDLRAMQRSVGIWLPGFAVSSEAVGLRGELDLEEVIRLAEAFTDAVLAVEVLADRSGAVTEYAFSAGSSGVQGLMEAIPRGLVRCRLTMGDPVSVVADVAGISPSLTAADGPVWTVNSAAYQRCDRLALAGDEGGAAAALTRAGVQEGTAKAWVAALCGRGSSAAITVVHRDTGNGRLEAGELRWVADDSGGAWRITASAVDETAYAMTPMDGSDLYAALRALMGVEGRHE